MKFRNFGLVILHPIISIQRINVAEMNKFFKKCDILSKTETILISSVRSASFRDITDLMMLPFEKFTK